MIRVLTSGESHGKALVTIIEGLPYGVEIDINKINNELSRRQAGYGRGNRMKIEKDGVEIISGIRNRITIGSPIAILIKNRDYKNWEKIMSIDKISEDYKRVNVPRPGHAGLSGYLKYGSNDIRDIIERSSARETAARVAAGALFKIFLENFGIKIYSHTISIGNISIKERKLSIENIDNTLLRTVDPEQEKLMIELIDKTRKEGDTLGGVSEIIAKNIPVGLGSYTIFDKRLDGKIGGLMLSIPSVKGVEIGNAFENSKLKGSSVHDEIFYDEEKGFFRETNRAGGIEGGISNGEDIVVRIAAKPIPTLIKPLNSVNVNTKDYVKAHIERSDVCVVPAVGVVGEAMLAYAIADSFIEKFGNDNLNDIKKNFENYLKRLKNE